MNPTENNLEQWIARANAVMPGRQSNFRPRTPGRELVFESAEGITYTDVTGNEIIDFVIGMGPAIWGHSNQEYLAAIHEQLDRMFSIGSATALSTLEIEVAEKIVKHLPSAEWVRYGISGSEAVQTAIRVARGYTGRPLFLRFGSHYHGWLENVFGGAMQWGRQDPPHAAYSPDMPGQSAGRSGTTDLDSYIIPWNDLEALEQTLQRYGEQIALILMEPVMCNFGCCPPLPGYLEGVRTLCDQYGVVLCFDEVITGFRMALDSAQGALGVTPDLTILGKAFAGGLPLSAVAGKQEILSVLREGKVLGGGTFNSFPLAMAGAKQSIRMMEQGGETIFTQRDALQAQLMEGIRAAGRKHGHDTLVQGPSGIFYIDFCAHEQVHHPSELQASDHAKRERFAQLMLDAGLLIGGGSRMLLSFAHTQQDIDKALVKIDGVMAQL